MIGEFSDARADKAFLETARFISDWRTKNPEFNSLEIAYGAFRALCAMEDSERWFDFLHEALNESIFQEKDAN